MRVALLMLALLLVVPPTRVWAQPAAPTPPPTITPTPRPAITITATATVAQTAPGGTVAVVVQITSGAREIRDVGVDLVLDGPARMTALLTRGEPDTICDLAITHAGCTLRLPPGGARTVTLQIAVALDALIGHALRIVAQSTAIAAPASVVVPIGTVPQTATSTTTPVGTLMPVPPTAPCYLAVIAALGRQGARYSQGGALPGDPRGADGRPLPRTEPDSFDCSGLVWWAYAQAGIPIGASTSAQRNDGVALPCTLDDLRGAATRCWAPGDLVFLRYPDGQHVAIYAGSGLFMDCYNHATGCVLHDVSRNAFYRQHFLEARRIVSGCEGMALDPGDPLPPPLPGLPASDALCLPDAPQWTTSGVGYGRGCGPPVLPGTTLRQFDGIAGWLGETGRLHPPGLAGVHLHLGVSLGIPTDMCRWPNQAPGVPEGQPPRGSATCWTIWADPLQFLPQANADTLAVVEGTPVPVIAREAGDATLSDAPLQLPPPGHPAGRLGEALEGDVPPGGSWWSPGNDGRARGASCPLGGPALQDWFRAALALLFPWWFGC
jgi:cell wall-associated NlpC family hydrolase